MNEQIERAFIEKYIIKSKQDRLLFELSGKKRRDGLGRFCHDAQALIRPERIVSSGNDIFSDDILEAAKRYGAKGTCCIMAYNNDLDGKICTLDEALETALGNGMPAIIICGDIAVVETEQCFGTPTRYILH